MQLPKLTLAAIACIAAITCSYAAQRPEKVIQTNVEEANLRADASTTAKTICKVPKGTQFEVVGETGAWFEAKEAWTGNTIFISKKVASELYLVPAADFVIRNTTYDNIKRSSTTEVTTKWNFSDKPAGNNDLKADRTTVYATCSTTTANTSGGIRTFEQYYKGENRVWYIAITARTEPDGAVTEQLEKPIVIYIDAQNDGFWTDGLFFIANDHTEQEFDTDGWD